MLQEISICVKNLVALTAKAMSRDKDLCLARGMDGFVSKPINVQELLTVIAGLCNERSWSWNRFPHNKTCAAALLEDGDALDFRFALI